MNAYLALTKSGWDFDGEGVCLETVVKQGKEKHNFYQKLIAAYDTECKAEKSDWYKTCYDRYYAGSNFGECTVLDFTVKSEAALAIGHGTDSVLETNLSLHPIYGVPYLPGTALKGLAAHYAHNVLSSTYPALSREGSDYKILFGIQQSAGFIQFHDALITPGTAWGALRQDVLTPHHQGYNGILTDHFDPKKEYPAPRDDDSPSPIPFLTAYGSFRIVLACEGEPEQATSWLELAKMILTEALKHEGIGAKTNAGYGRMVERSDIRFSI